LCLNLESENEKEIHQVTAQS